MNEKKAKSGKSKKILFLVAVLILLTAAVIAVIILTACIDTDTDTKETTGDSEMKAEETTEDGEYDPLSDGFGLMTSYSALKSDNTDTKGRFYERVAELPDEIPVVKPRRMRPDDKYIFYVDDKSGDDGNNGTVEKPFKTLGKALAEVSRMHLKSKDAKNDGITIYLRGGTYSLPQTVAMNISHSGTDKKPLMISDYNGEEVIFEMGAKIPGELFTEVTDPEVYARLNIYARNQIKTIDLKTLGITDYGDEEIYGNLQNQPVIYCGEQELTIARYPNSGTVSVGTVINGGKAENPGRDGLSFMFLDERPLGWKDTGDIALFGALGVEWNPVRVRVNIDKENHLLISPDSPSDGAVATNDPKHEWASPTSYYYYNVLEELDVPNEWYLDRTGTAGGKGKLYIYPEGDIKNKNYSYCVRKASHFELDGVKNVVFNGLTIRNGSNVGIHIKNCDKVVIQNCSFNNLAAEGVLINGCRLSGLTECFIYNTRRAGVEIRMNFDEYAALIPCRNFVQNCYIGRQDNDEQTGAVAMGDTVGCIISHNLIQNFAAYAIAPGGCENIIEYNEIAGVPKIVNDMAPIYWAGMFQRGTHVRYNYLHTPSFEPKGGNGIYFDELGTDCYAYGNIIDGFESGIYTHGGQSIVAVNNIVMNSASSNARFFTDALSFYDINNGVWKRNIFNKNGGGLMEYTNLPRRIDPREGVWKERYPDLCEFILKIDRYFEKFPNGDSTSWNGSSFSDSDEDYIRAPRLNYVASNISYNHGGISLTNIGKQTACEISNNLITRNNPGFADPDKKDYNMNPTDEVKEAIPDFIAPPFSKMGIIFTGGKFDKPRELNCIYPVVNSDVATGIIKFDWSPVKFTSYYELVLSENQNFENLTGVYKTANSNYSVCLPESGKKYYWKLTAYSYASPFKDIVVNSDIFSFNTINAGNADISLDYFSGSLDNPVKDSNVFTVTDGVLIIDSDKEANIFPAESVLISANDKLSVSFYADLYPMERDVGPFCIALKSDNGGNAYYIEFTKGYLNKRAAVKLYKNSEIISESVYDGSEIFKYKISIVAEYVSDKDEVRIRVYSAAVHGSNEQSQTKLVITATDKDSPIKHGGFMFKVKSGSKANISNFIIS